MDTLLQKMKSENCGLSVGGTFIGTALHADDVRTCAASKSSVTKQNAIISEFTDSSCLKLNTQKLEVLQIGHKPNTSESLGIAGIQMPLSDSVKCLGVWWQYNLSASRAVNENMQSKKSIFCTWKTQCISRKVESFVRQQYLRYLYTTYSPLRM